ncbi:MAG TPA: hypothetical protein VGF75_03655 [Candidatus Saccharimonadales bacterium]
MGKVIILEGPDGGGKTTLARELEEEGWMYKHEGPPPPGRNQIDYYLRVLDDSLRQKENVVHDRLWLGERIYGRISRNNDTVGELGQKLFLRLHSSKAIQQFICLPGLDTATTNYSRKIKEKTDYLQSMDKFEKVYNDYLLWFHMNGRAGDLYDYNTCTIGDVLNYPFLDKPLPKGTVGNPRASFLFIGDKPNHEYVDVPFHTITGSSGYFNEAIRLAGITEEQLAISNARDPHMNFHDPIRIINSLPNLKHVFLMGGVAQEWWRISNYLPVQDKLNLVDIHRTEHPSYLKRFHGNNPMLLANKIKECLNGATN